MTPTRRRSLSAHSIPDERAALFEPVEPDEPELVPEPEPDEPVPEGLLPLIVPVPEPVLPSPEFDVQELPLHW